MLYGGCLKKLTTTRYSIYPVISYSVSHTGYIVGYVVSSKRIDEMSMQINANIRVRRTQNLGCIYT
jgi:hypothetical protein